MTQNHLAGGHNVRGNTPITIFRDCQFTHLVVAVANNKTRKPCEQTPRSKSMASRMTTCSVEGPTLSAVLSRLPLAKEPSFQPDEATSSLNDTPRSHLAIFMCIASRSICVEFLRVNI